ncbi:hypothetical protein BGX28_003277 [Mortierella sp. GBA30]|nr:hypothetical protein BGX28_003277 [Mortierella sp. GBA30]
MVTTRNRSRQNATSLEPMSTELPTRSPRRTRQTKGKRAMADEESETVESSTPTPDSSSPPLENADHDRLAGRQQNVQTEIMAEYSKLEQDVQTRPENEGADADVEEDEDDDESESDEEDDDDNEDQKDEDGREDQEDEDDDDLDQLLVKAQASLKRKTMMEERNEPKFNFPKLETGLDSKDVYIKQNGTRAKVDMNTVVVVEKGASGSRAKSALETCEINMNAEKVHISKKQKKEEREKTTGKGWFDLPQQVMTPELKRDLQILKLRNVLDPKRFYKREEKGKPKFPKYFQVGTIIEGNTEFYSSRLTKKERATTITGEVMKDVTGRDYYKRKFDEIQEAKQSGGKRFNKKGKGKQSKSWRAGK